MTMIRPEHNKILILNSDRLLEIVKKDYFLLHDALNGADNRIGKIFKKLDFNDNETTKIKEAVKKSLSMPKSPQNSLSYPIQMNFELTTKCPLRCPQCYCTLEGGKDLDFDRACEVLRDGAENGLWEVNLSGGETMLYSRIYDLIEECTRLGVTSNVALSGYGVDEDVLDRLIEAGTSRIFVSLNGSTEEINSYTRGGYKYAVNALKLLSKSGFRRVIVNFVVHNNNCGDFLNMVSLCERYNVEQLVIMAAKPTSKNELETIPNAVQTEQLAIDIKEAQSRSNVLIGVESCYSPLRALLGKSFIFINTNRDLMRGCVAGRNMISLNVDGDFTPCRHLPFAEKSGSIGEYWLNSEILDTLRNIEDNPEAPCSGCEFERYCLSCLAVNYKVDGKLSKHNRYCAVGKHGHNYE